MIHDAHYFDNKLGRVKGVTQDLRDYIISDLLPHDVIKQTVINNYTNQTIKYELIHYVDVDYGSSTDQAPKIQAAIDNAEPGDCLRFKEGSITIRSTINVDKQVSLIGAHTTIFVIHGDAAIFTVSSAYALIGYMRFLGSGGAEGSGANTNQHGIKYTSAAGDGLRVVGIQANNLNGSLFYVDGVGNSTLDAASLIDCVAYNCKVGYSISNSAHVNLIGCRAVDCNTGLQADGLNVQMVGGSLIGGTNGLDIQKGFCIISGVTIADQSGFSVLVTGVPTGTGGVMSGCNVKGANIVLQTCDGFNINGCEIDVDELSIDTCTVVLNSNYMLSTPAMVPISGGSFVGGNNFKYVGANNLTAWT